MYEEKRREEQSRGKRIKSSSVDITLEYKQGDLGSVVLFVEDKKVDGFFFGGMVSISRKKNVFLPNTD